MKLATQIGDFNGYADSVLGMVELCSKTKFKYFDFPLWQITSSDSWRADIDACGNLAAKHGMTFVQGHAVDYNPYSATHDFEKDTKRMANMIEACSILGIENVVLHPAYPDGFDARYPDGREAYFEYNKQFYSLLFPSMEKYGVSVLTENSCEVNTGGRYFFMTGQDMADFLDYVGHPLLKAVWDTGHANIRKNRQHEDMVALGSRLAGIHVHDNDGNRDEHTMPYTGTLNLDMLMQGIIDSGYKGYFTFEANNSVLRGYGWPYKREKYTDGKERLLHPSLDIKLMSEDLLYETGKHILSAYGMYEE